MTEQPSQLAGGVTDAEVDAALKGMHFTASGLPRYSDMRRALESFLASRAAQGAQPVALPAWRTMESAPKDRFVLLAAEFDCPGDWRIKMGGWVAERERWEIWGASWKPVRWMELPAPPVGFDGQAAAPLDTSATAAAPTDAVLEQILRCRYPVCTTINPSGFGWDTSRLNEVLQELPPSPALPPTDAAMLQVIDERDKYHDQADDLAAQIAAITGQEIGEHSSGNDPWRNAMLAADEFISVQIRKLLTVPPVAPVDAKTYWAVVVDDVDEGVVLSSKADATAVLTQRPAPGHFGIPAIGDDLDDIYEGKPMRIVQLVEVAAMKGNAS